MTDEADAPSPEKHPTIAKLHERRGRHRQRHKVVRALVAAAGAVITLAGVVMTGPVPGPGFLIIPVGLALLALEFTWAERLLERAVLWSDRAKEQAANRSRGQKIAAGVLTVLALAGAVTAAMLWDIPVVPV